MKNKILIVLRVVLFSPFHLFIWLSKFYSKFLSFIDPNGSECYWEELSQKHINGRINSKLNLKNEIEYTSNKFDYNKGLNFYTPTKVSSFRAKSLFFKERDKKKTLGCTPLLKISEIADLKTFLTNFFGS